MRLAVIGGGLAGLSASIIAAKQGIQTTLFEKGEYPRNRVCGEYLSKETLPYLDQLAIDPWKLGAQDIEYLVFSNTKGQATKLRLPLGAIGISRFRIELELSKIAVQNGVDLRVNSKINDLEEIKNYNHYFVSVGKSSNLSSEKYRRGSYLAFKNYYETDWPDNEVGLFNFPGGYCGISKVETGFVNVCYMIKSEVFKKYDSPKSHLELGVQSNPILKQFFAGARPVLDRPLSISNIYFGKREKTTGNYFSGGDHAGMIFPLAGNGMSIAIQQGFLFSDLLSQLRAGKLNEQKMRTIYENELSIRFQRRMLISRGYQYLMGNGPGSSLALNILRSNSRLSSWLIKQTHG